ncbi:fatty acid synthase [Episyrphus balteatus]|uniref:fatty acid synthase n=1 Tax=Episyrphus balteatus TaxID=286459 RepID=UPI002486BA8E|nr:fatty acid synthase [Episyrphus balteatus]
MTSIPDLTSETLSKNKNKKFSRIFPETDGDQIVISGMSGKFPNSRNIAEYEYNLFNKIDMVDDDERRWRHFNPEIPKRAGKLYELEKFDATFFGVHFKQAHTMDPQCRVLMEVAYEAVIDAGINPKDLRGTRTGVYIGSCISESEKTWFYEKVSSGGFGITGCSRAMLANRISYALGLNGPSFLLDTACSSSMYALDNAFTALRNGEIDAAIIGGANLLLHPFVTLQFARLGVLASHGFCRPFDQDASGYTRAEAVNCMFLQRKRDAKRIYAEVIYSKTNCDGYKPEGITYPSGNLQEKLLREFYADVDVQPSDLGYLEAHSTGTIVGDPEECRAIDNVICSQRNESLLVGSVKSNVGHSEAASGICSLVKAVFAFEHGKIPPNINFNAIKKEIPALAEGRLTVVNDVELLPKPYIGVNSFGFGGANAHALLKACGKEKINNGLPFDEIPRIVGWAGRTEQAVTSILDSIEKRPLDAEYIGLLHNIQRDVSGLVFRGYGIFSKNGNDSNAKCLVKDIQHYTGIKRPLVWVFSGMGSQWTQMGASLMEIPIFRNSIQLCHNALKSKDLNLIDILTSKDPHMYDNILHSFVGIAAIQIGLVDILRALNLEPDYIIGHSVGELGCGYADGGFTPEQMILAAYYRGKVSLEIEKIRGSMAAIGMGYKQIVNLLPESIEVACHNGEDSSTISGPAEDVTRFVADLKSQGIFAKEVPCSNIAYHSRYIAHMGPQLLKYLKATIPKPKQRTSKWLSSSVPKAEWEQTGRDLCSAEYHTNNLLSSVLFEETFALLPKNSLTIEIAPHGLLQAILKRSMPGGVHVPLTQRGNKNNALFFLGSLGKLFNNGVTLPFENLYPAVQFPVSRGTPGIAALIKWDHNEDWFVTKYENMKTKASGERIFNVNLQSDDEEYLSGHVIDGKILVPATGYLQYVWETFSLMYHGPSYMDVSVEFEDVRFVRATPITSGGNVELKVMIHYGTGNFEITESNSVVVTGSIREIPEDSPPPMQISLDKESKFPMMAKKDFYKELKLRGYHYNGSFRAVRSARSDGKFGQIEWKYNWVSFMDAMLQIHIVGTDSRTLFLPTKIRKLRINGRHHFDMMSQMNPDDRVFDVYASQQFDRVIAGGVEMIGLHASPIQRKRPPGIPVLERYHFIPHFPAPKMNLNDAARICIQLGLENVPVPKIKIVEVDTEQEAPVIGYFLDAVEDLPVVTGDYMFLTNQTLELPGVHVENGKLSTQSNCYFILVKNLLNQGNILTLALKSLSEGGFLVARQTQGQMYDANMLIPNDLKLVLVIPTIEDEVILLLQKQKKKLIGDSIAIKVSVNDIEFKWIEKVQEAMKNGPVVLYAENEKFNGLLGLTNCLRKEPEGHLVRCVLVDDVHAPEFNLESPFYKEQLALGLGINVYRNGQWGTYRHLQLSTENQILPRAEHIYGNVIHRGDLSSLRWFEGPLAPKDCEIKIMYSSINFRDIMLATGRLAAELNGSSRMDLSLVLGFEYSGINTRTGKRIMSMVMKGGVASYVDKPSRLIWNIPENWSLQEAATVPVVYITVYYAFFMHVDIRKGKSILIHAGTGGIGLAAIRVALAYGLEVFTTVSSQQKREFLLKTFPELEDSHIGYSRDTSFEIMIQQQTLGRGVDFVLNSLSEEKLLASVRCLGQGGHFLEIGKFDMANDSKLGMGCFLKELTFHAVLADTLLHAPDSIINKLKAMIDDDIAGGVIQPLPSTVFPANEIEQAFRHLIGGKHIGKVLVQVRDDTESPYTLPVPVLKQVYFNPEFSYVIPGGLGGFGLELADWIVMRGAKKLVLSSSRGISKDYQSYRIALWKTYGCEVIVSTADITTRAGCEKLLKEAINCKPVGGIFNLAVVLRDGLFANQTAEKFLESFAPKALATQYLDELSRKMCPDLEQFIVFSSVSCGRGNAGQTNYGMANSIMERIIEDRVANGFPGKAVQWGAVGEVGLVADMAEDKIDMEIGGTLQQRISSCLQELDNLIPTTDAIVASMVVAEKRVGRGGNESITETVMNIMGIRDLKSVSLGMTLSEMGMDSLMAVEIKQTLERDFELCLSPQDLRSLTFQKLQEYEDSKEGEQNDTVKLVLASENTPLGMKLLLRNLGDEANCNKVLCPLVTSADASKLNLNPSIIIPGLEGTTGEAWYSIGKRLYSKSTVLQLHTTANLTTINEVAQEVFESVKSVLKSSEKFYIIGYSFGTFIALNLASLLEKAGYRGQVLLIDGAPHFLKTLTLGHLGADYKDEDLYNLLFSGIVNQIFPNESTESAAQIFLPLKTYEEKMARFMEFVEKQSLYSKEYAKVMVNAMFNRVKMAAEVDLESLDVLKAPITLVRPSEVAMVDVEEDYSLSKLTTSTVTVKFVEGSHTTMLDNPKLAKMINDFDPALQEDKTFELYLKDVKPVAVL